jgi:hypothetical protein
MYKNSVGNLNSNAISIDIQAQNLIHEIYNYKNQIIIMMI